MFNAVIAAVSARSLRKPMDKNGILFSFIKRFSLAEKSPSGPIIIWILFGAWVRFQSASFSTSPMFRQTALLRFISNQSTNPIGSYNVGNRLRPHFWRQRLQFSWNVPYSMIFLHIYPIKAA